MYKLVNWITTENWQGALIEDIKTGKKFLTNGVYKWAAIPERLAKCKEVESIDYEKFFSRYNKYITGSRLYM